MYPLWADAVGWIIGLFPVAVIFLGALRQICTLHQDLSVTERIKKLLKPTSAWGPAGRPCVSIQAKRRSNCCYEDNTADPNMPMLRRNGAERSFVKQNNEINQL